jgi:hypothetical protein
MALVFVDGFENPAGTDDPEKYICGTLARTTSGAPANSGVNGIAYLDRPSACNIKIPEDIRANKGIVSLLVYHNEALSGTVGASLVAVMEAGQEVASIRFVGATNNFPLQWRTYELFVAGVQVGTFNFKNWNSWERWVLVWDASGPAVTAAIYREGVLQTSGIGGQLDTTPIAASYSLAIYDRARNWTLKINSVTEASGYTDQNVYSVNFIADIGDEILVTESSSGSAAIFDGPNLTGNLIHDFGYNFNSASTVLEDPAQGYTPSGKVDSIYVTNLAYNLFDSVTVWDDPVGDLADARNPHWIQGVSTAGPAQTTSGDWDSYINTTLQNGTISDRVNANQINTGVRTTVADSELELEFALPIVPLNLVKIHGVSDSLATRATPALPNLEQKFKLNESLSSGKTVNASNYVTLARTEIINPETALAVETEVAEEYLLERTAEGGFNPTTGWVIDDANSVNKYYFGQIEGLGEGTIVFPSQDGGNTLGMIQTGSSNWPQYDTFYIYKDLDLTSLGGAFDFLMASVRARIPADQTTAFASIFDLTQNAMPQSSSTLSYGHNQLPNGSAVSRTNDFAVTYMPATKITGNTMRVAFQFSTRWDRAFYSEEAFPIIDWFEVRAFNAEALDLKTVVTARE